MRTGMGNAWSCCFLVSADLSAAVKASEAEPGRQESNEPPAVYEPVQATTQVLAFPREEGTVGSRCGTEWKERG